MSDQKVAIRCEGVSKFFRRNDVDPYQGLHSKLSRLLAPWSKSRVPTGDGIVWALRDVSFEVPAGGVFGVFGANGSGKSVLLKILARVTKPVAGRSVVYGSIGSILHLGAMLLPELTGRETIYQIGTILRLRRAAIDLHFAEIVDFSGLEPHLDSLVRGYSAGMQVRLAFAVMVYLDSDVLMMDEALSVADQEFRQRCVVRIRQMAAQGRTIVLVSHEMDMMADLCDRAMVLDRGQVTAYGDARSVIADYRRGSSVPTVRPGGR